MTRSKTTHHFVGTGEEAAQVIPGPLRLVPGTAYGKVTVSAVQENTCGKARYEIWDSTTELKLGVDANDPGCSGNDPISGVCTFGWGLVSMFTAPVSGIVAAVELIIDEKKTTRHTVSLGVVRSSCPQPRTNLAVRVSWSSGKVIDGITDATGTVVFDIPDGEPNTGLANASSGQAQQSVRYFTDRSTCVAERRAQMLEAQAIADGVERVRRLKALPHCGPAPAGAPPMAPPPVAPPPAPQPPPPVAPVQP